MRLLFAKTAVPLATGKTPGAISRNLRVMAMDGVSFDVSDELDNAAAFGYPSTHRNGRAIIGGYPRLSLCVLEETGTHVITEALVRPCKFNECLTGMYLLNRAPKDALVTFDRGFYSIKLLEHAVELGVHVLGRVGSVPVYRGRRELADGSFITQIGPVRLGPKRQAGAVTVRIIEYTIDDPDRPGHNERHRLVTTLLDDALYPAAELIALYHERWEIEIS